MQQTKRCSVDKQRDQDHRDQDISHTQTVQGPFLDQLIDEQILCDVFTQHGGTITGHLQLYTTSYLLILSHNGNAKVINQVFKSDINNIRWRRPFETPIERLNQNPPKGRSVKAHKPKRPQKIGRN